VQVITVSRSEWIVPFTGPQPEQFRNLVTTLAHRSGLEIAMVGAGAVESAVAGSVAAGRDTPTGRT
jgi:hypothetical protein